MRFLLGTCSELSRTIGMPARTLRRRVQRGRMNFYRAKRRHGLCQYCQAWDRTDSVELNKISQHLRGRLEALLLGFWVFF